MSTVDNINSDIAQKLELLQSTKADIQSAIADTGQVISDATPFSEYADLIRANTTIVNNGKSLIASAVTEKGVPTSASASFQTMATNILSISTGIDENKLKWGGPSMMTNYETVSKSITFSSVPDCNFFLIVPAQIYYAENNCPTSSRYITAWIVSKKDKYGVVFTKQPKVTNSGVVLIYPSLTQSGSNITISSTDYYFAGQYAMYCIVLES